MTRRLTLTGLAIAALLLGALATTTALAGDNNAPPPPGPRMHPGPHGPGGPGRPGMGRPWRGRGMGPGIGFGRGYIQPCPESKALWDKLIKLQIALHRKQWELFELLAKQPPDREAIKAKLKEIIQIRREMAKVHQELRKYWKPLPGRGSERPGRRGRWGRGGPHGRGGGQLPPPGN